MSLQRRRERYIIIHMWKIYHHMTSNDIEVSFTEHSRLGPQAIIPPLRRLGSSASQSIADSSFGILGPKLWNCIPATIRMKESLETFKSALSIFLVSLPDKPPIRGFTSPNPNSILNWRVNRDASALFGGRMCWWPVKSWRNSTQVTQVSKTLNFLLEFDQLDVTEHD